MTRILYIDDEAEMREVAVLAMGLDPRIEVRSCASGDEALRLLEDWPPDVVLLDVMMPGMDGPATLARLRETESGRKVPVIFITARAKQEEVDRLLSLGAVGVIPKPFNPRTLAATVMTCVQNL